MYYSCIIRYPRSNVLQIVNECFTKFVNVLMGDAVEYTLHKGFIVGLSKINEGAVKESLSNASLFKEIVTFLWRQ